MQNSSQLITVGKNLSLQQACAATDAYMQETRVMCFPGQRFTLKDHPYRNYDSISLNKVMELVRNPATEEKENALSTIGSNYCAHDARKHDVQSTHGLYSLLRFDIDTGNSSMKDVCEAFSLQLGKGIFMVYSTSSATKENQRWRVLIPVLQPVNHTLRRAGEIVLRTLIQYIWDIKFDQVLDRAGQHICLPTVAPNKRDQNGTPNYYESRITGEKVFDLELSNLYPEMQFLIEQESKEEEQRQAALEEQIEKRLQKHRSMNHSDDKKRSPIEWFNQRHSIEDMLIETGYEQSSSDMLNWRSPLQTSPSYATRVYEEHFVTLSGSDASAGIGIPTRNGYRVGDAFTLFVHFIHGGDRNKALNTIRSLRDFAYEANAIQGSDNYLPAIKPITRDELQSAKLTPAVILPELIYADARIRIAPGGSSKTTIAVHEAVILALGRSLWGHVPERPVRTVFITREDSREILVARIRSVMHALMLDAAEQDEALQNIVVLDLTSVSFRLSAVQCDVVIPHQQNLRCLVDVLREWHPDWVICDPLVSFGVGESRVNDAEQGLIEAFRLLRNELNCCIEGIHHTGKAVARDKVLDQYAGRGGSALADGARMVVVMQPLSPKEWSKSTGTTLAQGETGLVMAFPKLSYCKPQPSIFIRRAGFRFAMIQSVLPQTAEEVLELNADKVHEFLFKEYTAGQQFSVTALDACTSQLKLTRAEIRDACEALKTQGRVIYQGGRGKVGAHYEPLSFELSSNEPFLN